MNVFRRHQKDAMMVVWRGRDGLNEVRSKLQNPRRETANTDLDTRAREMTNFGTAARSPNSNKPNLDL